MEDLLNQEGFHAWEVAVLYKITMQDGFIQYFILYEALPKNGFSGLNDSKVDFEREKHANRDQFFSLKEIELNWWLG